MHNCRWLTKQHTQSLTRVSKERDRHRGGEREGCMACERDSTKHVKQLLNGHPAAATICTCTFVSTLCVGYPKKSGGITEQLSTAAPKINLHISVLYLCTTK